jgi:hypothetical protein
MVWSKEIRFWREPNKLGRLGLRAFSDCNFYRVCLSVPKKIGGRLQPAKSDDRIYTSFNLATFRCGLPPHCQTPPRETNGCQGNVSSPARPDCDSFGDGRKTREIQSGLNT